MDFEAYYALHARVFGENGLDVSRETAERFYALTERMLTVNEQMNLTAVRDVESVIYLHYVDSLKLADHIPQGAKLCDVGCGAGFPSLPLAITREDLQILALDSTDKKVRYVAETAELLGVASRLRTKSGRAEEFGRGELRGAFDCVTARAVSNLQMLAELCLPLAKKDGLFLSMKGANWETEYAAAKNAIRLLGGAVEDVVEFEIRNGALSEKRAILVIRKASETPEKYPRAWGRIKSKPL